jgi:hypothetical protein
MVVGLQGSPMIASFSAAGRQTIFYNNTPYYPT